MWNAAKKEIVTQAVPMGSNPVGGVYAFGTNPHLYCHGAPTKAALESLFDYVVCGVPGACLAAVPHFEEAFEKLVAATTSPSNPWAHGPAFTLPVISLVFITILNDGCMITISQDYVVPDKKPQTWRIFEASVIACVIGLVATLSSLILVVGCLHNNIGHANEGIRFMASSGRAYLTWFEVRSIIYLKVSVSDFLTLFSARTKGWFWERRLSILLGGAACVALLISTLFALYWDIMCFESESEKLASPKGQAPKLGASAYMSGLRNSEGAVFCVWIYCVLWWLIQDVCKVGAYRVLERWEDRGFQWNQLPGVFGPAPVPMCSKWEATSDTGSVHVVSSNPLNTVATSLGSFSSSVASQKAIYTNPAAMKH